jgi:ABC-type phosphate transport system substrate-binding protein
LRNADTYNETDSSRAFDNLLTRVGREQGVILGSMKYSRILCLCAWVTLSLTPCFAHHMAVVVNKDNIVQNFTSAHLAKIFKGEVKKWPDGRDVVLVLHGNSPDEMVTLEHLTKMTEADLKALIASHKDSIRTVGADADVIGAVASTPGAIGLVEEHSITDRVGVVKVDGKLPMESGYLPH